ncbi:MAG: SIS domain-containing protein [Patescibacteria group bacterium]
MHKEGLDLFNEQFAFRPKIMNRAKLRRKPRVIVCGMGGSHWAADLIKIIRPDVDLLIWNSYGLPKLPARELRNRFIIVSSYSGNTEEPLSSFDEAKRNGFPLAAVAVGGALLARAKKYRVPYVELPNYSIQPRMALGISFMALLTLMGDAKMLREAHKLRKLLRPRSYRAGGFALAKKLAGRVPLIYGSQEFYALPYIWKIKINETGKFPAFANMLPELNHNEMTGFDMGKSAKKLARVFHALILAYGKDDPRIIRRGKVLQKLYRARGIKTDIVPVKGRTLLHAIFASLLLAEWTAYALAIKYGAEPEQVPMVEEFKKHIG